MTPGRAGGPSRTRSPRSTSSPTDPADGGGRAGSATPRSPLAVVVLRGLFVVFVVGVVGLEVLLVLLGHLVRPAAASELALQRGEVGVGGVVLQFPGHLRLLGLSSAAPHGSTPSHRNCGAAQVGRAPTTSGISRGSYGTW